MFSIFSKLGEGLWQHQKAGDDSSRAGELRQSWIRRCSRYVPLKTGEAVVIEGEAGCYSASLPPVAP